MPEYKKSVSAWAPVRLLSSLGVPVTGVLFGSVTCAVLKSDGSEAMVSVLVTDWSEATTGALLNSGTYRIRLPAIALDTPGFLIYSVVAPGAVIFVGEIDVVSFIEADSMKFLTNRTRIDTATKQMYVYDDLGTGVIYTFNLKDAAGIASATSIFEKVP